MNGPKNILVLTLIVAVLGIGGWAFAHDGYGYPGDHMGYGGHMMGYGYHMGRGYGSHMGYDEDGRYAGLTDQQIDQLDRAQAKFFEETENLRNDIYQKRLEMRGELAKKDADAAKLNSMQKELSQLEAKLDQKRLNYEIERNKIAPGADQGYARRGYDRGFGGYCWN